MLLVMSVVPLLVVRVTRDRFPFWDGGMRMGEVGGGRWEVGGGRRSKV